MFIVDIETTGLGGLAAGDKIVEVGVCRLNRYGRVVRVYHRIVQHADIMDYKFEWVFQNTTLTPEEVLNGTPEKEVIEDLHKLLDGKFCTSFNTSFDFESFLLCPPYNLCPIVPFDIADLSRWTYAVDRYVHAEESYLKFCPDDPAGMGPKEHHRALDDAFMEAHLLKRLLLDFDFRGY